MRTVRRQGNVAWTFEEFAGGRYEAKLYYKEPDGSWSPPLPPDVAAELPVERSRSLRGEILERLGGEARLVGSATPHPRRAGLSRSRPRAGVTRSAEVRPSWQIGPDSGSENWRLLK